ncbi:Mur ligase family protein [Campylobacter sp. 19-13652]|uniref:Mur ligase family protein n=1 Tax=Campylobacter sp. 19-13652 TaxID=2840180 RepID=UPI001C7873B7|nr:Mur ligase family protein [Campylobacter sp. 19-13652]BCX79475.1 UDP-N-acetylmuramoyl-tripeptide--D-alanyl-D-alanine ligase [Campylobacter sp. 19-13652]
MKQFLPYLHLASSLIFTVALAFYMISCFQWFNYKLKRVLFHFTKPLWHLFFAIIPVVLYYTTGEYFAIYLIFAYIPAIIVWHKRLDKKLVFTARVKRFFVFLLIAFAAYTGIYFAVNLTLKADSILPIIAAMCASYLYERLNMAKFYQKAKKKLESMPDLTVILITASYGKTSMKNFLYELLKDDFICYKTPRSVNTESGIIKDINENLPQNCQIYIAEAGARERGDIYAITRLLSPKIVIVGEIGSAHLEYFKSIDVTRNTKLEALKSTNLKKAFLHSSTLKQADDDIIIYDSDVSLGRANLDGIEFKIGNESFSAPLLGGFHTQNLAAVIKAAKYLGAEKANIKKALSTLKNPEHRLFKMEAGGKIIIDDSFNGNINGMLASYNLAATYPGRKVLITPGIVEGAQEDNKTLAKAANDVFDVVMITGALNAPTLLKELKRPKIIIVKDKSNLTQMLAEHTMAGDLVLFSNDAPSFI